MGTDYDRQTCQERADEKADLYSRLAGFDVEASECDAPADPARPVQPARPSIDQVTMVVVQRETKHLPFPAVSVRIEPSGKTLVNFATNVYTNPGRFERTVSILTWPVRIRATPSSYSWNFGDGTVRTTDGPGGPMPGGDVTHKYLKRGSPRVSVTANYDAWYLLPGGDWQQVPGVVSIPGPGTPVLVCEARPVLTDPDNPDAWTPEPDPGNPCTLPSS